MDKSKKYIEMCEKAEEIQRQKSWTDAETKDFWEPSETSEFIWLPRQDQLQEMLAARGFSWLVITFFQFCKEQLKEHNWLTGQVNSPLDSLEKLWLAFVMKEKYKKTWNSKEWVKDEL